LALSAEADVRKAKSEQSERPKKKQSDCPKSEAPEKLLRCSARLSFLRNKKLVQHPKLPKQQQIRRRHQRQPRKIVKELIRQFRNKC